MRAILPIAVAIAAAATIASCGPSYQGSYPSYEAVISQYVPAGVYEGVRLDDAAYYPAGSYCNCPRVWYDGRWVYYYHGRWIYWYHDCWYYYPVFYVYYWGGIPYVYTGPVKSIHQAGSSSGGAGAAAVHHAYPPSTPAPRSFDKPSPARSTRSKSNERDSSPPSRRKGGRR
jgi:hypothetical protein